VSRADPFVFLCFLRADPFVFPPTPSSSGKTLVVASSRGNAVTTAEVDGKPITIGLNAYIKK
jgi:hypothetical protein